MIDVILITGFLGSGKTTFLNQLLPKVASQHKRVAVVMNEFGSVGIDGKLIDGAAELVELQNGSVFCVCIRDNFLAALANLARDLKPEIVVIEATGVADPFEMGDFLAYPGLEGIYKLHRTITVVDAVNFPKVIHTLRAARAQAQAADVFVVTKSDLLELRMTSGTLLGLQNLLQELSPTALQIVAPHCRLSEAEWETVLGFAGRTETSKQYEAGTPARDPMVSITITVGPFTDSDTAREVIANALPLNALRAKGFVDIGGNTHLFQYTMGRVDIRRAKWDGGATSDMSDTVESVGELVIIGFNLRRDQIGL